ncbi:MAG: ATP-binding protein [Chloroflexi bacterium]|nr:MAG: ATP-binding protein [Chloroflexota bacterium]
MPTTRKYRLSLDLRVLDHLGIKLYSNAAAVLSEAVANAWDADAKRVSIDISSDEIVIVDNGVGMDLNAINQRFLSVGYDKRAIEGEESARGRPFMGRKGIGKLALFSIAGVIEVHTSTGDEQNAFKLVTDDIRTVIQKGDDYFPTPIAFSGPKTGTRIVLHELKKKRTGSSVAALRKRIARRFSIIGFKGQRGDTFSVEIDGEPVDAQDREDLRAVEFLWEFGEERIPAASCPELKHRFVLDAQVDPEHPEWVVGGWFGTVDEPKRLKHEVAGPLNGIVVISRGRLIQENILDRLNFSRVLVSYLTGQVVADFLDLPGADDIATSDRQRLVEDDPRYEALVNFLRSKIVSIQDEWTNLRNEARGKQAIDEIPALADWLDTMPHSQRGNARRLLGLIRGIELDEKKDRIDLYRSGMLAFERLRLREEAHRLTEGPRLTAEQLLPLLSDLSTLEGSLYLEIVRVRLDVLREFEALVDANEKEKVLQRHLFDNLWLLDPGWERAAGSERLEQILKKEYKVFDPNLDDRESKGRVDIRYRTNAGQHIIVELKRAGRVMKVSELVEQGTLYATALKKCLKAEGHDHPQVSVVFVVGTPLAEERDNSAIDIDRALGSFNGRVVHYETLIRGARDAYDEYLKAKAKVDRIDAILRKLVRAGAA